MRQQTRTYHDWPSTWALVARYVIKVDLAKSQKKGLNLPYSSAHDWSSVTTLDFGLRLWPCSPISF